MSSFPRLLLILLISLTSALMSSMTQAADDEALIPILEGLKAKSFSQKAQLISELEAIDDDRVMPIMKHMLEGELYFRKDSGVLVFAKKADDGVAITDVLSGEVLGVVGKREIKKIRVNNALRSVLRNSIAKLSLNSPKADVRLNAVRETYKEIDADTASQLHVRLQIEEKGNIREALQVGVALYKLSSDDQQIRLNSVKVLGDSLAPVAKGALLQLLVKDDEDNYVEQNRDVRKAAQQSLKTIESKLKVNNTIETVYFGLSLGSVLLLAAIGLAITFGVMGVINMAHGELIMLGAYTTYVVQLLMPNHIEYSLFVAIPAAFLVSGLVGIAIERGVIRFLYGRPLETLLATFGISLILQQLVRTIFSPLNRSVETPDWMSGTFEINSALMLTYNRLYIIIFSLIVFAALLLILKKTSLGLHVRAVSQNRTMAKAMGIKTHWVDALTFGLGSGIAGIAGVALSQLTNVGPNLGQAYIIDSFMVVVFGGVGNLWGTLVGAMSLGVINKILEPWAGAVLAKILVLVFIILFIQKHPRGLFPQRGRAAEH